MSVQKDRETERDRERERERDRKNRARVMRIDDLAESSSPQLVKPVLKQKPESWNLKP